MQLAVPLELWCMATGSPDIGYIEPSAICVAKDPEHQGRMKQHPNPASEGNMQAGGSLHALFSLWTRLRTS